MFAECACHHIRSWSCASAAGGARAGLYRLARLADKYGSGYDKVEKNGNEERFVSVASTSVSHPFEPPQRSRAIDDRKIYMTAVHASEGDIVRIDLDEQACCFAKLLVSPLFCFYDNRTPRSDARPVVDPGAILFKVWVSKEGWTNTRWKVVGHEDLSDIERESPTFFKIDPIKKDYYLYGNARFMPASREECIGLERAAVWDPVHVEERLRAHFAGERSIFADSLKA